MSYKLELRQTGETLATLDMWMIPLLMADSEEELKSLLMPEKEQSRA